MTEDLKSKPPQTPLEQVASLSEYGASENELAATLGLPVAEMRKLAGYREARRRGEAKHKLLLRQAAMKRAIAGDAKALSQLLPTTDDGIAAESSRRLAEYLVQRAR